MRIFAYMRFSSENQIGGVSIEMQRTAIANYINLNPELKARELIERIDEAKSATTLKGRDGLASIRNEVRSGDIVIVFKLDRLGRNLYDSLKVLKDFEDKHVRVISTSEPDMPLVRHMLLAMSEEFSRQLSDRCKRALDSIAGGGFVANGAPYGYAIERVGSRGKLVPVPEQAVVIQRIFQMRADGHGVRKIVGALNADKITSPKDGRGWSISCIHNMLKNETYRGTITSGQRIFKKGEGLKGWRPHKEWIVARDAHEAIVSEKVWDAVRSRTSAKALSHPTTITAKTKNLLTGFLKCSDCGGNLTLGQNKGKRYYGCQSGRDRGLKLACQRRTLIGVEHAVETIISILQKQVFNDLWIERVVTAFKEEVQRARQSVGEVLPAFEQALKKTEAQIASAERRLVHVPEDSIPVFLDELRRLKAERDEQKARLENARSKNRRCGFSGCIGGATTGMC